MSPFNGLLRAKNVFSIPLATNFSSASSLPRILWKKDVLEDILNLIDFHAMILIKLRTVNRENNFIDT